MNHWSAIVPTFKRPKSGEPALVTEPNHCIVIGIFLAKPDRAASRCILYTSHEIRLRAAHWEPTVPNRPYKRPKFITTFLEIYRVHNILCQDIYRKNEHTKRVTKKFTLGL